MHTTTTPAPALPGGAGLNGAGHAGQALGIGIVIFLWVAADVILGLGRLVVVTSRRRSA